MIPPGRNARTLEPLHQTRGRSKPPSKPGRFTYAALLVCGVRVVVTVLPSAAGVLVVRPRRLPLGSRMKLDWPFARLLLWKSRVPSGGLALAEVTPRRHHPRLAGHFALWAARRFVWGSRTSASDGRLGARPLLRLCVAEPPRPNLHRQAMPPVQSHRGLGLLAPPNQGSRKRVRLPIGMDGRPSVG